MDDISRAWTRNFLVNFFFFFYNPGHEYKSPRQLTRGGRGQRWNKKRANKESWELVDIGRYWGKNLKTILGRGCDGRKKTWLIFPGSQINFDRGLYIYIPSTRLDLWANLNDRFFLDFFFFNREILAIIFFEKYIVIHTWAQYIFLL